ncbi:MAG: phosphoribosylformylglycinamidine cyclo-ligase [Ignavibacteriae bacterium]|nr:phosphoribosylformylglycinamidine cyclo-ligase [Ignavibacteria bacterium]MBI3363725.1 phosphoribosylformylglycinamidine cyclo-ligase [Ignavibacteriota bacterium]
MTKTYKDSGVDIAAGDEFVGTIKEKVRSTFSKAVLTDIGTFGALYDARFPGMEEPVLVSSIDGVGTKLKVAFLMDRHDSVGQDIVNHCVNDIAVLGAKPLFFLDYFATGKLKPRIAESVVQGMIKACRENGCSLVGGETAEMSGFYRENEYDIAGTIVGVVEKKKVIDGRRVKAGDLLVGLPSTGLHTNGYSLARSVLFERFEVDDFVDALGMRLGEALLAIHRSYLKAIQAIIEFSETHALSHITGGGIVGNTSRIIPKNLSLRVNWKRWQRPALFNLIQEKGRVPEHDMRKTFNLGVGLVIIVSRRGLDKIVRALSAEGEKPFVIGEVVGR